MHALALVAAGAIGTVIQTVSLGPHRMNPESRPPWFFRREQYGGILPKGSTNKAAFDAIIKSLKDDGSLAKFAAANLGGNPSKVPVISAG